MTIRPPDAGFADRAGPRVLAFVMANDLGGPLQPPAGERRKPTVPIDGKHRPIDFVLSNLVNSGILSVYVVVGHKSQRLSEHVRRHWSMPRAVHDQFVTLMPPQACCGEPAGVAFALGEHEQLIRSFQPDVVAVFGADNIYRMDVRQMLAFHQQSRAHVTVGTLPVRLAEAHRVGVVQTGPDKRIVDFQEKPRDAQPMAGSSTHVQGSMGNYLFDPDVLLAALKRARSDAQSDFGRDMLPAMVHSHRLMAYDFTTNKVPGIAEFEESAYWRDVSEIDPYFAAQFDTVGTRPRFRLDNREWPIRVACEPTEPARIESATVNRSMLGSDCLVDGATLDHAVLRRSVTVQPGASLEHCIVMDRCVIGAGARLRKAIIDTDNMVPAGERIGFDLCRDRERFQVSDDGVVVVPAGHFTS